jgi:hypothetical protein
MGRTAHVLGITSGLALALTALVNYGLVNWDFLADMPEYLLDLKWIIPLATGIAVAVATIVVKWEPYVADRNEPHFVMSVAGLIVPTVFLSPCSSSTRPTSYCSTPPHGCIPSRSWASASR